MSGAMGSAGLHLRNTGIISANALTAFTCQVTERGQEGALAELSNGGCNGSSAPRRSA